MEPSNYIRSFDWGGHRIDIKLIVSRGNLNDKVQEALAVGIDDLISRLRVSQTSAEVIPAKWSL